MKMLTKIFILSLGFLVFSLLLIKQYGTLSLNEVVVKKTKKISISTPPTISSFSNVKRNHFIENKTVSIPPLHKHYDVKTNLDLNKLISVTSSQGLQPKALKSALNAYLWALNHGKLGSNKDILTVIDFTLPSYEKRMWVLNLRKKIVLMKLHTTQGAGSGLIYANRFSNTSRTQASSIGLYTTSEEYYGKHGKSMRLDGLQKGINNNARNRSIVIHEAAYATPSYIKANHRAGRSWGCFAVAPSNKKILLNYVRGGSAFFVYAHQIEKVKIISDGPIAI
jgi:hypothetical protein